MHIDNLKLANECAWISAVYGNTELAQVNDTTVARAKRICILMIKVNKLFVFFL